MITHIAIEYVDLSNPSQIERMLRNHKIPLDRIAIVDYKTGELHVAEGGKIEIVLDHMSGNPVLHPVDLDYNVILPVCVAGDALIDSVFIKDGDLVDKHGNPHTLTTSDTVAWTQALLSVTFGS
jgi:hypothetical protein